MSNTCPGTWVTLPAGSLLRPPLSADTLGGRPYEAGLDRVLGFVDAEPDVVLGSSKPGRGVVVGGDAVFSAAAAPRPAPRVCDVLGGVRRHSPSIWLGRRIARVPRHDVAPSPTDVPSSLESIGYGAWAQLALAQSIAREAQAMADTGSPLGISTRRARRDRDALPGVTRSPAHRWYRPTATFGARRQRGDARRATSTGRLAQAAQQ